MSNPPLPDFKSEKFLRALLAKASERGYTPTQLVNQCLKIDQLEKKHSKTFDDLKNEFDQIASEISAKRKKIDELEGKIAETQRRKKNLQQEYLVEEGNVRDYIDARSELSSIGFPIDNILNVKTCLFSLKSENFQPETIVEKLNSIANLESRKKALEFELGALAEKLGGLESKYQARKAELEAYSCLRAMGVDGNRVVSWHELIDDTGLDFGTFEAELRRQGNLTRLVKETNDKVKELQDEKRFLASSIQELAEQRRVLEVSISAMRDAAVKEIENSREAAVSALTQFAVEVKRSMDLAKDGFKATLGELGTTTNGFADNLDNVLRRSETEIVKVTELLEVAERIGKYEALMPLLKLSEGSPVSENQAMFAMWNMSNLFRLWLEKQDKTDPRVEVLGLLKKTMASLNLEIQRIGN